MLCRVYVMTLIGHRMSEMKSKSCLNIIRIKYYQLAYVNEINISEGVVIINV
jgi:hypothetical protein